MMQTDLVPLLGSQREHHEFALRAETAQIGYTIIPGPELTSRHASIIYRIMQIVCGGKLSWFSRINLQSQRFSSEFFLSYYKMFRIAVQSRKFSDE